MENSINYEYISKLPLECAASLTPGKISGTLFPQILQGCEVIVLQKEQKWLLRKENTEEYLITIEEQGSLELYSRKKLFKRLLPDYYNDPAYVYPPTKSFLDSISATLEQIHEQMRYEFQNALYTTCKSLWALSEHQKLWDFLGITPELDIFHEWLKNQKPKDIKTIMDVQEYLSQLCIKRIQTMVSILFEGAGTRDAIQKAFCAFFNYQEADEKNIQQDDKSVKHYILRMKEKESNTVDLIIQEPIYQETLFDQAKCDQSSFDLTPEPGFSLFINSNFNQFSILPREEKVKRVYEELDSIAKEQNKNKGKEYFEKLIFLIKAAGVGSRIYYTLPIFPDDGSKYHEIASHIRLSQEVHLAMPKQEHRLSWSGRFDQDKFDQCYWTEENFRIHIHQNIPAQTNSHLQKERLSCYNICTTIPSEQAELKPLSASLSLEIRLPKAEQLWQESKWDQAKFDQAAWGKPTLSWLISPARFDISPWNKTLFA